MLIFTTVGDWYFRQSRKFWVFLRDLTNSWKLWDKVWLDSSVLLHPREHSWYPWLLAAVSGGEVTDFSFAKSIVKSDFGVFIDVLIEGAELFTLISTTTLGSCRATAHILGFQMAVALYKPGVLYSLRSGTLFNLTMSIKSTWHILKRIFNWQKIS